jgi:hypothetical protein
VDDAPQTSSIGARLDRRRGGVRLSCGASAASSALVATNGTGMGLQDGHGTAEACRAVFAQQSRLSGVASCREIRSKANGKQVGGRILSYQTGFLQCVEDSIRHSRARPRRHRIPERSVVSEQDFPEQSHRIGQSGLRVIRRRQRTDRIIATAGEKPLLTTVFRCDRSAILADQLRARKCQHNAGPRTGTRTHSSKKAGHDLPAWPDHSD